MTWLKTLGAWPLLTVAGLLLTLSQALNRTAVKILQSGSQTAHR